MRALIVDDSRVVSGYVSGAHLLRQRPVPLKVADDHARAHGLGWQYFVVKSDGVMVFRSIWARPETFRPWA